MLYTSTRGNYGPLPAAGAIKLGIAPDGGLFVPTDRVMLSVEDIQAMTHMSYQQRAANILGPYLADFTPNEIKRSVDNAYDAGSFDHPDVAPLVDLDAGLSVLELWHGPTCAFKDMALQILPHLLVKSMEKTDEDAGILILVATSGDTGKAALEGFKDVPRTAIMVFYPEKGVSQVQKMQMVTQEGGNVGVYAVRGNFDDTQSGVKAIFGDADMQHAAAERGYKFSSANSINWGRLVPQIVYYFSAYADLLARKRVQPGEAVNFVVPTGNFGNILAGFYAKQMGLPVHRLVCAANENNVLTDFIATGTYDRNRDFKRTISPSMDILISSNLERLLYELTGHDAARVRQWMADLMAKGRYTVDDETREQVQSLFWSEYADDTATMSSIKDTHRRYGYVVDTHTAVGLYVYHRYRQSTGDERPTVVLSTASPFKFNASVARALLGEEQTSGRDEFELLQMLSDFSGLPVPPGLSGLSRRPVRHTTVVDREQMPQAVLNFVAQNQQRRN
ncbi:threonine synthase [Desulfoscipio gibsoniae]|uniref:Threonine synthase n=1 Tax=Desulfoscipio gibsoniae DSM 7213 TaxID=767817 RepID=R4KM44_9FIRM|nr:threonine synthase [Desulfoscipio gibsoniae]AGL01590.1 threonine synthase [Desulfoscipio gibsoniae DSM 7213]